MDETNSWLRRVGSDLRRAFSIDYRSLALFRVICGGVIVADMLMRLPHTFAFLTDKGVLPLSSAMNYFGSATWSVYFLNGSPTFAVALQILTLLAGLALLVGYRTRAMTFVCWVLVISIQYRNPFLIEGSDALLRLLLLFGFFLPLGARFSVDAALERKDPYPAAAHFNIATVAILMQVMYVYWVGALLKVSPLWTSEFTAIEYVLHAQHMITPLGHWVVEHVPFILSLLTRFVYLIELIGPLLMFVPFFFPWIRLPVLFLLICMHIGFVLLLNVGYFPFISIASLVLLVPSECWDFLNKRWTARRSENIVVYYDKGCEFCLKTVHLLRTMLILPGIRILPAQDDAVAGPILEKHDSWVVAHGDAPVRLEWEALTWLVSRSPVLFWLSWPMRLVGKLGLGDRIYHFIGNRRDGFGRVTKALMPWRETTPHRSIVAAIVVIALSVLVFQINLSQVSRVPGPPAVTKNIRTALGLGQRWEMFNLASASTYTRWPVIEGVRKDGSRVDIFRGIDGAASLEKPTNFSAHFKYYRWRRFHGRLAEKSSEDLRLHYTRYKCRLWKRDHPEEKGNRLQTIQIRTGYAPTRLRSTPKVKHRYVDRGHTPCRQKKTAG